MIGMPFEFSASDICEDKRLLQLLTEHINKNEELRFLYMFQYRN